MTTSEHFSDSMSKIDHSNWMQFGWWNLPISVALFAIGFGMLLGSICLGIKYEDQNKFMMFVASLGCLAGATLMTFGALDLIGFVLLILPKLIFGHN